ncbi:cupin-like domain-containing protein [Amphritea sp.]|uniref:cupin-like domain-containing protein n=1 Tax=Amphritea sp. TaxID=1872502 RepID=UPI003A8DA978
MRHIDGQTFNQARPQPFMLSPQDQDNGFFDVARVSSDISFADFCDSYLTPEVPVVIEGAGKNWPARERWNEEYLHKKLAKEASASAASLWYWLNREALVEDYTTPPFINQCLDSTAAFPRKKHLRLWINKKGNVSRWHYDSTFINVFNAQITGTKDWILVSPDTPIDCYPFTTFSIIDDRGDAILKDKIYTRFTLNEGDIVYIPPVWFHQVTASGDESINLNWLFTKKETTATSATLKREVERYIINDYLTKHRFKVIRHLANQFNKYAPAYAKISWHYSELIKTPYTTTRTDLLKRFATEVLLLGKTLRYVNNIKSYTKTLSKPRKITKI